MGMLEIGRASEIVQELADVDAEFIFGASLGRPRRRVEITVVATGFEGENAKTNLNPLPKRQTKRTAKIRYPSRS